MNIVMKIKMIAERVKLKKLVIAKNQNNMEV
jgi:hypothetical protein